MILAFLASRLGQAAVVAAGIVALLVAFASHERSKGEAKAVAKMERNNAAVQKKADAAGRKSRDDNSPGVLNPHYRAD